jgi:hypothetical protein
MQGVLHTQEIDYSVDCLELCLKFQPLGRPFLLEFGDHSLKSSLRTIDLPQGSPAPSGRH